MADTPYFTPEDSLAVCTGHLLVLRQAWPMIEPPDVPVRASDSEPLPPSPFSEAVLAYIEHRRIKGGAQRVLVALAGPQLTRARFAELVADVPAAEALDLGDAILDAILFVIGVALADHQLTYAERRAIRGVQHMVGLEEGELLVRRPVQVADLLEQEIRLLLEDRGISPREALHQVALQEVLGLSYDQYLQLTRPGVDQIVDECIAEITASGLVTEEGRHRLEEQLRALDTTYTLMPAQRSRLASAGLVIAG